MCGSSRYCLVPMEPVARAQLVTYETNPQEQEPLGFWQQKQRGQCSYAWKVVWEPPIQVSLKHWAKACLYWSHKLGWKSSLFQEIDESSVSNKGACYMLSKSQLAVPPVQGVINYNHRQYSILSLLETYDLDNTGCHISKRSHPYCNLVAWQDRDLWNDILQEARLKRRIEGSFRHEPPLAIFGLRNVRRNLSQESQTWYRLGHMTPDQSIDAVGIAGRQIHL